jgi:peptide chain release factor 2
MKSLSGFGVIFDLDAKMLELERLDSIMSKPGFWDKSQDEVSRISQERSNLKDTIDNWNRLKKETEDLSMLIEMASEEEDKESIEEFKKDISDLDKRVKNLDLQCLMSEPDDRRNCIVSINAGAGGTESQDWVEMLYRMYLRWCESKGYKTEVIDYMPGDEAGVKSVTFSASGPYAYGFMNAEHGVHRMVRISPFDATGRRLPLCICLSYP